MPGGFLELKSGKAKGWFLQTAGKPYRKQLGSGSVAVSLLRPLIGNATKVFHKAVEAGNKEQFSHTESK